MKGGCQKIPVIPKTPFVVCELFNSIFFLFFSQFFPFFLTEISLMPSVDWVAVADIIVFSWVEFPELPSPSHLIFNLEWILFNDRNELQNSRILLLVLPGQGALSVFVLASFDFSLSPATCSESLQSGPLCYISNWTPYFSRIPITFPLQLKWNDSFGHELNILNFFTSSEVVFFLNTSTKLIYPIFLKPLISILLILFLCLPFTCFYLY